MIEFHKSDVDALTWTSDFFGIEQKKDIENEVLQKLYDIGVKATTSTLSQENNRALKLRFNSEEDEAIFILYKSNENAEENNW
jgi:hypothetical protein